MLHSAKTKHGPASSGQELAQMRQQLIWLNEKAHVLRERSEHRDAYRYLMDAHRLEVRKAHDEDHVSTRAWSKQDGMDPLTG